ncbi:MAG: hypothetical protein WC710_15435 [Gallionella sp.]|jgi:hypothetical protein
MMFNDFFRLAALLGLLVPALGFGSSFTLDFRHPDGEGSPFADTIPLQVAGAIQDATGLPIGFTRAAGSAVEGGKTTNAKLTSQGLWVNVGERGKTLVLGVPFFAKSVSDREPIRITARFEGVKATKDGGDFAESFEYLGVGVGPAGETAHTAFSHVKVFGNRGEPNFNAQSGQGTSGAGGSLAHLEVSLVSHNGHSFQGVFNGKNGTGYVVDVLGRLTGAGEIAAVIFHRNGNNQFTAILTSVTFEAPSLAVPSTFTR